jgi:bla regulator protein BlaR1
MKRMFAGLSLFVIAACTTAAQTATEPTGFEVASIRPSDPAAGGMDIGIAPGGLFTARNVTLKALIQQAYDVRDFQVSGGPSWLDTQRYDIVAKGNGVSVPEDDMRKMTDAERQVFEQQFRLKVQALLTDRFQLKVHRVTREIPIYALSVARNGPKIQAVADSDITRSGLSMRRGDTGQSEITGTRVPLASLVKALSNQVGRTVLDQTGLKGNYDFKLVFAPDLGQQAGPGVGAVDRPSAVDREGPSIFTALQEQLGLRLDAQKGLVEAMVIDSAEKASEN